MINLLSHTEQKTIYREYMLRIGTLVLLVLGIIGSVICATLVPSYMRLDSEISLVELEQKAKQELITPEDQKQISEAKTFLSEIQVLRASGGSSSAIAQIEQVLALKPARIALVGFQYENEAGKSSVKIRGKADRREDLLDFKALLETKAGYSDIELPSQTLIKRTDIQFQMDLRGSGVKTPKESVPPPTDGALLP